MLWDFPFRIFELSNFHSVNKELIQLLLTRVAPHVIEKKNCPVAEQFLLTQLYPLLTFQYNVEFKIKRNPQKKIWKQDFINQESQIFA